MRWILATVLAATVITGCSPLKIDTSGLAAPPTVSSTSSYEDTQRAQAAHMDRANYRTLAPRDFALLVKDPDSHKGQMIVVYGKVTQFDSATGRQEFRASTGPDANGDLDQNTYVTSPMAIFDNVVAGDTLRMFAAVEGVYSYQTTMGGHMSVPKLTVYMVDLLTKGQ